MKALRRTVIALAFLLTTEAAARAAEDAVTLTDTVKRALDGNVELQRERVGILTADANIVGALGQFDVSLTGGLTFQRVVTPKVSNNDFSSGTTDSVDMNIGVTRALESGGQITLNLHPNRTTSTSTQFACTSGQSVCYANNWTLAFQHPLLRNFGVDVTLANLRKTRIQKDMALLSRMTRASNVLRDVITGYWELAYALRDLAIRNAAVELAREQLRITQAQIEVGRLSPVESAAVERAINDRLQEVSVSQQQVYYRSLDLRRLFGLPADPSAAVLTAADAPSASAPELDAKVELTHAMQNNPQLQSLRMGIALSEQDIITARSQLKPRLDFFGQVGTTGRDTTLQGSASGAAAFDNLLAQAGLQFQFPIQNRVAIGQRDVALMEREGATLDARSLELDIRDAVSRRITDVDTAQKRLGYAQAAIGFAEKNLAAEQARFSVGRSTNNDVLLRQQELKLDQLAALRATVDILDAEVALAALTGDVLDRYGLYLKGS